MQLRSGKTIHKTVRFGKNTIQRDSKIVAKCNNKHLVCELISLISVVTFGFMHESRFIQFISRIKHSNTSNRRVKNSTYDVNINASNFQSIQYS